MITTKLALAQRQLETAIGLFLSRRDRVSAITLAGAADGILHGLVIKAGKKPFADLVVDFTEARTGKTPAKSKVAKHINDTLKINHLKHMDEGDGDEVSVDVDIAALSAIMKAIANHHTLVPDHPDYIDAMLQWAWMFYDGEKIREDEPYVRPAGEKIMSWYSAVTDEKLKAESEFAKKFQKLFKKHGNS